MENIIPIFASVRIIKSGRYYNMSASKLLKKYIRPGKKSTQPYNQGTWG